MNRAPEGPAERPAPIQWHVLTPEDTLARLGTRPGGLSAEEAARRLAEHGPNALPEPPRRSFLDIVAGQLRSVLIYLLLAAAAVSMLMGEWADAGFIFLVLAINTAVGTLQEARAEENTAALRSAVRTMARVLRDGTVLRTESQNLVPGDVVLLEAGGRVPADLRLLDGADLQADESFLTGESLPVDKRPAALPETTVLAERACLLFAGAMIVRGRASAVVVATGTATEIGQLARSLETPVPELPLTRRMARFTKTLGLLSLVLVAIVVVLRLTGGAGLEETLLVAVALAVSVIPEGLPVSVTVALSIATARMARRNVIVRQLPAVEGLGACTVIATDKTGTLTVNKLTARRLWLPATGLVAVGGEGYATSGDFRMVDAPLRPPMDAIYDVALSAALCNDASLANDEDGGSGDTVDLALLVLASKAAVMVDGLDGTRPRVGEMPFSAERRFAATLNLHEAHRHLHVKGAAEVIVPMCEGADAGPAIAAAEMLAAQGYRVLAIATKQMPHDQGGIGEHDLAALTLLGLVGFIDPLRPEAIAAVAACRRAGVEVRMITGDHALTAFAIAEQLGIAQTAGNVVTGAELARATTDPAAAARVATATVFARVEPAQKVAIVDALRAAGHVVAMTGDGVNDAPALRHADVGVAMGRDGTDTAREASDIILADDNFASIVAGIEEGRAAYANIRKVVYLLISTGAAEALMYILSVASGLPLPLGAVQLLWLNLVTNGGQDVALAFEKPEPGLMAQPPRRPDDAVFDPLMIRQTVIAGGIMGLVSFAFFAAALRAGYPPVAASNLLLFLLVLFENVQTLNARSETRSVFAIPLRDNPMLVGAIVLAQSVHIGAAFVPGLRNVLGLSPIDPAMWAVLLAIALTLLGAMELDKALRRRKEH